MNSMRTAEIWNQFSDSLHRFLLYKVKTRADADDILQDVFIKVHQNIERLRDEEKLESWLFRITRNAVFDYYKKEKPKDDIDQLHGEKAPSDWMEVVPSRNIFDLANSFQDCRPYLNALLDDSNRKLSEQEVAAFLRSLCSFLGELPLKYAEAVFLSDWYGMSQVELASRLGISVSGAKSRVQRGREKMKDLFMRCCEFEFDARGSIIDYHRRNDQCKAC